MSVSRLCALAGLAVCCVAVVGSAGAAPTALPQQDGAVDLLAQANLQIDGAAASDGLGTAVASAGDVNGDGRADLIVGAESANNNGRDDSGSAYVVFGREDMATVNLADLGTAGFRIDGAAAADYAGGAVAGVGDVNGDGRADVAVGAPYANNNSRTYSGSAYVVFGKTSTAPVDLAALGEGGFRIDGAAVEDSAGYSLASVGDVNGDGRADVVVGAPYAANNGRKQSGSAYVVFGKTSTATIDLAALGGGGYRIDGAAAGDEAGGPSIGGAGDVNGDGRPDVVVGAPYADNNGRMLSGSAYVVFGKTSTTTIDLAALGAGGYRIDGAAATDGAGRSVAGAGDVNGDGRPDVVVGAWVADNNGRVSSGSAYVVFGKQSTTTVDLAALGAGGYRIDGAAAFAWAGYSVAGAGDVNGDGRRDVIVGAPVSGANGRKSSGSAFVVFGKQSTTTVDLATLEAAGLHIDGAAAGDEASESVAGVGDVNGDGRPDVVVGAPDADNNGRKGSGSAYVVYGFGEGKLDYQPLQARVGRPVGGHRPSRLERTGTPSFAVRPPLPAGLRLEGLGVISGTPREALQRSTFKVRMRDLAGEADADLVLTVAPQRDTRAPGLTVRATSPQQVSRSGDVRIRVSCSEACTLGASGTIVGLGTARKIPLLTAGTRLRSAGARTLRLRLTPSARTQLASALAAGTQLRVTVSVRAQDAAGNTTVKRRTLTVR